MFKSSESDADSFILQEHIHIVLISLTQKVHLDETPRAVTKRVENEKWLAVDAIHLLISISLQSDAFACHSPSFIRKSIKSSCPLHALYFLYLYCKAVCVHFSRFEQNTSCDKKCQKAEVGVQRHKHDFYPGVRIWFETERHQ